MIAQGLVIMVTGMATVFIFLTLLVIIMNILEKIANQFFPYVEPPVQPKKAVGGDSDAQIAAAIAAATAYSRS